MKMTVKLYRVTSIFTKDLVEVVGGQPESFKDPIGRLSEALREKFSPMSPRFKIFFPASLNQIKTNVGMEAMSFNIQDASTPQAGLVMADPMLPQDVDRLDGALEGELNRMGLGADFENYEWRVAYETKGN